MVTMKKKPSARRNNAEEKIKTEFARIIHPSVAEDYENKLVGLTTLGRDIWFDNGWNEFVGRYGIHEGFFLLFQYTGCSRFLVIIFDETATEITYPRGGDLRAAIVPCDDDQQNLVKDEEDCIPDKKKTRTKCKSKNAVTSDGFGLASIRDSRAICEARNYQPADPYFQVLVQACDIESGSVLHVPAEFSDKHLDTAGEYMKILAPGGRKWLVELTWKREGGVTFRNGWHQFCRGNGLREGDVCVIEFVKEEMEFKASIFRAFNN